MVIHLVPKLYRRSFQAQSEIFVSLYNAFSYPFGGPFFRLPGTVRVGQVSTPVPTPLEVRRLRVLTY